MRVAYGAALLACAAPALGWTNESCGVLTYNPQKMANEETDRRCCHGWRPECHVSCTQTCIVEAVKCDLNDHPHADWKVRCTSSPTADKIREDCASASSSLKNASYPLSLIEPCKVGVSGSYSPTTFLLRWADKELELIGDEAAVCAATFNLPAWMNKLRQVVADILGLEVAAVEVDLPQACGGGTSNRRRAGALALNDTFTATFSITTAAPTSSPTEVGASGDPFTTFGGKQTQFYLPLGAEGRRPKPASLITCGAVELHGEAFGSGIPGDSQQWFRAFDVYHRGSALARVEVRDVATLADPAAVAGAGSLNAAAMARNRAASLLADAAAAAAADEKSDVTVAQIVESRVAAALQAMHFADAARDAFRRGSSGSAKALTTLNVTVAGKRMDHTGAETIGSGASEAFVAVTQDSNLRIAAGYSETVAIGAEHVGLELQSAVAQKFHGKEAVRKTHVDLRFTQLNVKECLGPLPEIWGTKPMSAETAKMLLPPKV